LDNLSVILTIHLLSDTKASKDVGSNSDANARCSSVYSHHNKINIKNNTALKKILTIPKDIA